MAENVYSSARILKDDKKVEKFELSNFGKNKEQEKEEIHKFSELKLENEDSSDLQKVEVKTLVSTPTLVDNSEVLQKIEPIFSEFEKIIKKIEEVSQKVTTIEQDAAIKGKDLDTQVVKAIKDLKQCATFFEQAAFGFESKLLKTSISIAQKIINIEVGENSSKIAKQTINQLLLKLKNATKVKIHLNPKDYYVLKQELELEPFIELFEDANVVAGGVVIASNLGNFDGSIEANVSSMLESLHLVI